MIEKCGRDCPSGNERQTDMENNEKVSGSEALVRALIEEGVDTMFGYPGGAIMPVYDALMDHLDVINHILVRHEQGATHAAEGYARASGKVGVCLVTGGPGATNTLTGIADAMLDSTPIIVIAGQISTDMIGTDAFQEVDFTCVTQPICKWSYQISSPEEITWAVSRAFFVARSGRPGPVVLSITKNAQVGMTEYIPRKVNYIRSYDDDPEIDMTRIREAAAAINSARRPFVLAGQGIELGDAQEEFLAFVEKAGLPFGCTLLGLSVAPSSHPLNKGMLGMHGNYCNNVKTNECDVLIAVGMRFDDRVTGNVATYARQAKIIHLDIDPSEIGKNVPVDIPVLGNCRKTLPLLTERLLKMDRSEWIESFRKYQDEEYEKVIDRELHPVAGPLNMGEVVAAVSSATGGDAILVTDVGQNQMMASRYFRYTRKRSIITSGGMGTMGFGIPAAVGAALGRPDRTVCVFTGDGGLQMMMQEFGTIMEHRIPVKMILLNNSYLGNVRQWQELFYNRRYSFTHLENPDFQVIASAYGIPSRRVLAREVLKSAVDEMLSADGPFFLEACVAEEGNVMPMTPPGKPIDNMLMEC